MRNLLLPLFAVFAVASMAFVLIFVVVARSPYTHANLRPEGYNRTEIALVGEEPPFEGFSMAHPSLAVTGDPVKDGRALFFKYGCASCHGLQGQGGTVGKEIDIDDISLSEFRRDVRRGPKGMPSYGEETLSDGVAERVYIFLKAAMGKISEEGAAKVNESGLESQESAD
jgi:hypothetical protein